MFQSTEKNQANKDLLIASIVGIVVVFYLSLAFGAASNSLGVGLFSIFSVAEPADYLRWMNPVFILSNQDGESIGLTFMITVVTAGLFAIFYLDGRRRNHDMEGKEQGSADWLLDYTKFSMSYGKKGFEKKEPKEAAEYRKKMMSEEYTDNIMFDNTYGISMNTRKTLRNLHMLVIGGSGAGKTRFFVKPNILQMNSSYIVTDPSGELFRDMGQMLKDNNYDVRVFNTFDPNMSMQYNPLSYIRNDADVTALITTLIKNTGEASGDNKYFDDATKLLLSAIILFLIHYCPKSEHDFAHVMQLVVAADVPEGQKNPQSDLDKIFEQVEIVDPNGLALKMYKSFKSTSGKSLKSVLSSTATRLTVFNYAEIERLTCADTISLSTIGDEKCALFIITPPTDNGFNFLVAMMYSQLFSTLYYHTTFECRYLITDEKYITRPYPSKDEAEYVYNLLLEQNKNKNEQLIDYVFDDMIGKYEMVEVATGKILAKELRPETVDRFKENPQQFHVKKNGNEEAGSPFHVRMLMDEFANINEIPSFSEVLATIRKYNVSIVIILQSLAQLKKNYEKDYGPIVGNCDTFVFLGAQELETTESVSKMLGNTTITVRNAGESMGKNRSTNFNYGQTKRELMTPDELSRLPTSEQIIIVRAMHPFRLPKFKLEQHPNFHLSADGDSSKRLIIQQWFNLEKKIAEYEEAHGISSQHEDQDEINKQAQQTVGQWMKNPISGEKPAGGKEKEDEFFF